MLLGLLHVHITSPSCMNSGCIISISFVTIPASSAPLNPPPPILTMPPKVGPPPDDKSEVASPSPISTNASSNQTSPPPSPKAPANSSTKPQELSPPPPSTSPPQNLPPPPPASGSLQKPPPPPINWPPPSDRHNLPPPPSIPPPSSVPPPPSVPPPSSVPPPPSVPPPSSVPPPPSVPPPSSVPPPPSVPPPSSVPPPPSVPPHAPSYIYGTPTGPPVYPPPPLLSPPPSSVTLESPPPPLLSPPPTSKTLVFPPPALLPPPPPPPSSSRTRESPPPPLLPPPSTSGIPIAPTPPLLHPPPTSVIAVSPTSLHISPITPSGMSLVPQVTPTKDMSNNSPKNEGGALGTRTAVEIGVTVSLMLLAAIGITFCFMCLRKKKYSRHSNYLMRAPSTSSTASGIEYLKMWHSPANSAYSSSEISGLGNSRCLFTYKELAKATNEFSEKNLLGEGGFGLVFKGCLPDGREVAVKQLKEGGGQGEREFRAEVETISHIHHKHLVSLVGYCICKSNRLLIYDYVPNKTLHFHLHEKEDPVLDWAARLKIALGAARGIAYLHEDCQPRIIHRDIKSSNILIDNNFEAQVSDFGLARLFSDSYTHVTTRVMGTFGYMAPEYALSGKLTDKSDVFSFGVVLLELITGRKPVDSSQPSGEESLVEWARPLLDSALEGEDLEALVDPRLKDNYVDSEMFRLIEAAASCIRYFAAKRPKMMQVLRSFDGITVSNISNGMRVGESKMCDVTLKSGEFRLLQNMAFGGQYFSSEFYTQGSWKREDCEM